MIRPPNTSDKNICTKLSKVFENANENLELSLEYVDRRDENVVVFLGKFTFKLRRYIMLCVVDVKNRDVRLLKGKYSLKECLVNFQTYPYKIFVGRKKKDLALVHFQE